MFSTFPPVLHEHLILIMGWMKSLWKAVGACMPKGENETYVLHIYPLEISLSHAGCFWKWRELPEVLTDPILLPELWPSVSLLSLEILFYLCCFPVLIETEPQAWIVILFVFLSLWAGFVSSFLFHIYSTINITWFQQDLVTSFGSSCRIGSWIISVCGQLLIWSWLITRPIPSSLDRPT